MFKWQSGRQNNSYNTLTLINFKRLDCYLIKINKWAEIPLHFDRVEGYKHYRLNIRIKGHYTQLFAEMPIFFNKFITLFRPDINKHSVGTSNNEALIFSFGWLTKITKRASDENNS